MPGRAQPFLPIAAERRQIPNYKVSRTTDPSETGALWKWFRYVSHNLLTKYLSLATFNIATANSPRKISALPGS